MEDCSIEHFSHEHPLSFFQLDDFDDPKPHICTICQLPILYSPSYTCTIGPNCNFFLHDSCTQFPKELYHDAHCDTLILQQLRPDDSSSQNYFTYRCRNYSRCEFELHPLVAKPMEIVSKHMSHDESHPLVACCKKIVSQCDACGEKEEGFFFHCEECNFWIHQDCTILPTIVNLLNQPHFFILTYSLPFDVVSREESCYICSKPWHLSNNGVYFSESYQYAHVSCAKTKMMKNLHIEIIQLPDAEELDTYPSLVIRTFLQTNQSSQISSLSYHHKHPLIQIEHGMKGELDEVCDVCIQPIDNNVSSPFYTCQLSEGCNFVAHLICATNLPTKIQLTLGREHVGAILCDSDSKKKFLNSVSPCVLCLRPSNGFAYTNERGWVVFDVECALAPKIIKHASHRQHFLFQTSPLWATYSQPRCCSGESSYFNIYTCLACNFSIHLKCALLPKYTRHKFDEHPLVLITDDSTNEEDNELKVYFCEVCEEEIELKLWYYGCHECEQYFHIDCIPSVGYLSKLKFGKTHDDPKLHQHPLTLTRMLTHQTNERCGLCKKIIKGFSDDQMAFHCSTCHFWIHFSCASTSTGLKDYSKVLQLLQQSFLEQNYHKF